MRPISNINSNAMYNLSGINNKGRGNIKKGGALQKPSALPEDTIEICLNKAERIKQLIDEGNYTVSSKNVAEKILNDIQLYHMFNIKEGK